MAGHPFGLAQRVVDMSIGSNNDVSSVSIYVGPEHRHFILLGQVLNKKSIDLALLFQRLEVVRIDQSEAANTLDEFCADTVDAEAFNLFAQWLHGIELPWVQCTAPSLYDGCLSQVPLPAQLQTSGALEPLVEKEDATGSAEQRQFHIVSRAPYRKFSTEEIRLADMLRMSVMVPSMNSMTFRSAFGTHQVQQSTVVKTEDTSNSVGARASVEEENECIQTGLLKLMLLAEMAGWKRCFHDAMDNYRHGEIQIKRNSLNLDHIDLAYSTIASARHMPDYSPTLHFMADYAYFKGTEYGLLTVYQELFAKFPRFFNDIRLREKDLSTVPGMNRVRSDDANITAPLGPKRCPLRIKGRYRAL